MISPKEAIEHLRELVEIQQADDCDMSGYLMSVRVIEDALVDKRNKPSRNDVVFMAYSAGYFDGDKGLGFNPDASAQGGEAVAHDWVDCPICGEPDMQRTTHEREQTLIHCCNANCLSNGGTNASALAHPSASVPEGSIFSDADDARNFLVSVCKPEYSRYISDRQRLAGDFACHIASLLATTPQPEGR